MTLAAFLVSMVGPLVARILVSLGLSLVTMTGLVAAVAALKSTMISQLGSLPADGLQLAGLYGIWDCVGMALGAATFVITWAQTKGFWSLVKT